MIDIKIIMTGIICITALEAFALYLGFNGVLLTTVIAIIAGAIGFTIPSEKIIGSKK